jgi:hypothetical protein
MRISMGKGVFDDSGGTHEVLAVTLVAGGLVARGQRCRLGIDGNIRVSDRANFTGLITQSPTPAGFVLKSTRCTLTSDADPVTYPCQISGQFSTTGSGSATMTSKDGTVAGSSPSHRFPARRRSR